MESAATVQVQSESMTEFARVLACENRIAAAHGAAPQVRIAIDPERARNGLGQLVLAVVKLLHELLERQAVRRVEAGSLSEEEIERVGLALMRQAEEIERLRQEFGLREEDLNLDLGPLGKLF